jgi:hypothetical protein
MGEPPGVKRRANIDQYQLGDQYATDPFKYKKSPGFSVFHRMKKNESKSKIDFHFRKS